MNKLGPRVMLYLIHNEDTDAIDKIMREEDIWGKGETIMYERSFLRDEYLEIVMFLDRLMNQRLMNEVLHSTLKQTGYFDD